MDTHTHTILKPLSLTFFLADSLLRKASLFPMCIHFSFIFVGWEKTHNTTRDEIVDIGNQSTKFIKLETNITYKCHVKNSKTILFIYLFINQCTYCIWKVLLELFLFVTISKPVWQSRKTLHMVTFISHTVSQNKHKIILN